SCSTASPPAARAEQTAQAEHPRGQAARDERAARDELLARPAGWAGGAGCTGRDKLLVGGVTSTPQRGSFHASDKKLVRRPRGALRLVVVRRRRGSRRRPVGGSPGPSCSRS